MVTRRMLLMGLLSGGLLLSGCGEPAATPGTATSSPSETRDAAVDARSLTDYDATAPLDLRENAPSEALPSGGTVQDVSWVSPGGGRVTAWLVVPDGTGPFAGIVYQHGSETDRDDLLDEAEAMASGGAVSLVVDAPFARRGSDRRDFLQYYSIPERERDMTAQAIADLRRAFDVLVARADVDPQRLAYVGHSWGASAGVILAAVDPRPGSLVLLSGRPSWTGFLAASQDAWVQRTRKRIGEEDWQAYLDLMAPFDAMSEIASVDATRLYLQYGTADDVVPPDVARQLTDAAAGARVDWYDGAGHALDAQATADRIAWLVQRLSLAPISADVVAAVGLPDE